MRALAVTIPLELDEFEVVRRGPRWVALSEGEARVFHPLLERQGRVVTRAELLAATGSANPRLLDSAMVRLRRRLEPLGVVIHTVRTRGYLLELLPDH